MCSLVCTSAGCGMPLRLMCGAHSALASLMHSMLHELIKPLHLASTPFQCFADRQPVFWPGLVSTSLPLYEKKGEKKLTLRDVALPTHAALFLTSCPSRPARLTLSRWMSTSTRKRRQRVAFAQCQRSRCALVIVLVSRVCARVF